MNCLFLVCRYKLLVFWKLFPCEEEKEQLIRRPLQTFRVILYIMNGDKIIPQNSPIGIASVTQFWIYFSTVLLADCKGFYLVKCLLKRAFRDELSWLSIYCSFSCLEINTSSNLKGHLASLLLL